MQVGEGQIFLRRGTELPIQLHLPEGAAGAAWLALADSSDELFRQVAAANWHLFRLSEGTHGWAIARSREKALDAALRKALRKVKSFRNAAEIVAIRYTSALGVHCCRVLLAARHVQREAILPLASGVGLISPAVKPEEWTKKQEPLAA